MIEVIYWKDHNRVTVKGHAGSDEKGKDLICAGASALAVALGANVARLCHEGYASEQLVRLTPGDAEISCKPKIRYRLSVQQIFQAVCVGFEMLARQYGEFISYECRG